MRGQCGDNAGTMRGQNGDKTGTVSVCGKNYSFTYIQFLFSPTFAPCLRWFLPCTPESLALVPDFVFVLVGKGPPIGLTFRAVMAVRLSPRLPGALLRDRVPLT